ncbi:LysM peptidoglycan-binding domain-containing protein [Microvirgula aerodenitrificans]|uniref:LysM peptidoglycan-binding domain-containing protein n=1 Tax=Microvirgula aerodenitrificans TaxID=57480 RepID=UPI0028E5E20E|nr:LysM peptidoglycan-binding domain-containing protein [Microvirgula aerodenitrificans]
MTGISIGVDTSRTDNLAGAGGFGQGGERVRVDAASGRLQLRRRDDMRVSVGPDIELLRSYNSLRDDGDNWRFGYARRLHGRNGTLNAPGSSVRRTDEDGVEQVWRYDAGRAAYIDRSGGGADDLLRFDPIRGTGVWTDGDSQREEHYDAAGRLLAVRDPDGHALTLAYDDAGRLSAVTGASGETLHIDYLAGRLAALRSTDARGEHIAIRYRHDASGRLQQVETDLTPEDGRTEDGLVYLTRYGYDGESARLASIDHSDGGRLEFTHVRIGDGYRVQSVSDVRSATDRRTTTFDYDLAAGTTSVTDPLGQVCVLQHDAHGRLLGVDSAAGSLRYEYDAAGRLLARTDAAGHRHEYQYDARGNVVLERGPDGRCVRRRFGERNELLAQTIAADSAGAQTTRHVYDDRLRRRFEISAAGRVTEYRYDADGHPVTQLRYPDAVAAALSAQPDEAELRDWVATQDPARVRRRDSEYDLRGQLSRQIDYARLDATGLGLDDGRQQVQRFVHDAGGLLLLHVDAGGGETHYQYDGLRRQTSRRDALGNQNVTVHTGADSALTLANGLTRIQTRDPFGRELSEVLRQDGVVLGETRYHYDRAGRLRRQTDPLGQHSHLLYDAAGRKVADIDAAGTLTEYRYDAVGRCIGTLRYATPVMAEQLARDDITLDEVRPLAGVGRDQAEWRQFDAAGRLQLQVDARGAVTRWQHDAAGQVVGITAYSRVLDAAALAALAAAPELPLPPMAQDDEARHIRQFHDSDGLLLGRLDGEGFLTEYHYDGSSQLTGTTRYAVRTDAVQRHEASLDQLRPAVDATDQHTRERYDGRGLRIARLDAEGYLTEYRHDEAGRLSDEIRHAHRGGGGDAAWQAPASHDDQHTRYRYDVLGRLIVQRDPNGLITRLQYDSEGRLQSRERIAGEHDSRRELQRHDSRGRLVAVLAGEGAHALAALAADAPAAEIEAVWARWGTRHRHDDGGRRIATVSPDGVGGPGRQTLYYYDPAGRLTHTINPLGEVSHNSYDAFGRQIRVVRYASRLDAGVLAGLRGGASHDIEALVPALSLPVNDSTISFRYGTHAQWEVRRDGLGHDTFRHYNAFGELSRQRDPQGEGRWLDTDHDYDLRGRLTSTRADPDGLNRFTRHGYDAFGQRIADFDARQQTDRYQYDRLGRRIAHHDANGQQQWRHDAFGREIAHIDAAGRIRTTRHDTAAGTVLIERPGGLGREMTTRNRHGEQVRHLDGRGLETGFEYDHDGRLIRETRDGDIRARYLHDSAGQRIESRDGRGTPTRYHYDAAGRLQGETVDPDGLALQRTYLHDALGRQVRTTGADGVVSTSRYDRNGRVIVTVVDPGELSLVSTWNYDAQGRVLQQATGRGEDITTYRYDLLGRLLETVVNPHGLQLRTTQAYDKNGNLQESTDALGQRTLTFHDRAGRLQWRVAADGSVHGYQYDANGRETVHTAYASRIDLTGLAPGDSAELKARLRPDPDRDRRSRQWHDALGRRTHLVDASGYLTEWQYDGNHNLVTETRFANAVTLDGAAPPLATRSGHDRTDRYQYDRHDRRVAHRDAEHAMTRWWHDGNGNITRVRHHLRPATDDMTVADDAGDRIEHRIHDAANRLVWQQDGTGAVSESRYDQAGRLLARIRYAHVPDTGIDSGARPVAGHGDVKQTTDYDVLGRPVLLQDGSGNPTRQRWSSGGRLLETVRGHDHEASTTRHDYDSAGRLVAVTRGAGSPAESTVRYKLDALGQRVAELGASGEPRLQRRFDPLGRELSLIDALGGETRRAYDAFGNTLTLTDARGYSGHFRYDASNREVLHLDPEGYATRREYDAFGALTRLIRHARAVADGDDPVSDVHDQITVIEHDRRGRQTRLTDAAGHSERQAHDALGNKILFVNKLGGHYHYRHDGAGRVVEEQQPLVGKNTNGETMPVTTRYRYDTRGNLIEQIDAAGTGGQRSTRFAYDGAGRQLSRSGDARLVYDLDGVRNAYQIPTETRRYDSRGNLIAITDYGGRTCSTWYDVLDRKVAEHDADGYLSEWEYNDAGQLLWHARHAGTVDLPADGQRPVLRMTAMRRETRHHYDALNRRIATLVPAQRIGSIDADTGNYRIARADLISRVDYDATGNIVGETDARGNRLQRDYDRRGHKRLEIDASGQVTAWQYDAFGNVTRETRHATLQPVRTGAIAALPPVHADDRVREYDYDGMNRVVEEREQNVAISRVDAGDGSIDEQRTTTRTRYLHNGLGQVIRQIDASGGQQDWHYWANGWQISHQDVARPDEQGRLRRPATDYQYDLLHRPYSQIRRGGDEHSETDDRVTRYRYSSNDQLEREDRADGSTHLYGYDASGHRSYHGLRASAGHVDWTVYRNDAAGRKIERHDLGSGLRHDTRYDAWGQVVARRIRVGDSGKWQEYAEYDGAGRLIKGNLDDGINTAYVHDENGNVTLTLRSATVDLRPLTMEQILARQDVERTISVYDASNRLTDRYQPKMAQARERIVIEQWHSVVPQQGGGVVTVGPSGRAVERAETSPLASGSVAVSPGSGPVHVVLRGVEGQARGGRRGSFYGYKEVNTKITLPFDLPAFGEGGLHIYIRANAWIGNVVGGKTHELYIPYTGKNIEFNFPVALEMAYIWRKLKINFQIYKKTQWGEIKIAEAENYPVDKWSRYNEWLNGYKRPISFSGSTSADFQFIHFLAQPLATTRLLMSYRLSGHNHGWTMAGVAPMAINGQIQPGWFASGWAAIQQGQYELQYHAIDNSGHVVNSASGQMGLWHSGPTIQQTSRALGGAGKAFMASDGGLHLTELGSNAIRARLRIKPAGGNWGEPFTCSPAKNGDLSLPGWFILMPATVGATTAARHDYTIETFDAAGTRIGKSIGHFIPGNADSVSALTAWADQPQIVHFDNQPLTGRHGTLRYRLSAGSDWQQATLVAAGEGRFRWDATDVLPNRDRDQDVEFEYEIRSDEQRLVNRARGQVRLGTENRLLSHTSLNLPSEVRFAPSQTGAVSMQLNYARKGETEEASVQLARDDDGTFRFDVSGLMPDSGQQDYAYRYALFDHEGKPLLTATGDPLSVPGTLRLGAGENGSQLQWVITGLSRRDTAIHRRQHYDAFGQIVREQNGLGRISDLVHDGAGRLIEKTDPETSATGEDGNTYRLRPTTRYYHDALGNPVGVRDANGRLNSQILLPGTALVTTGFRADGSRTEAGYDLFGNQRFRVDGIGRRSDYHYDAMDRLLRVERPEQQGKRGVDRHEYDTAGRRIADLSTPDGETVHRASTEYDSLGRVTRTVSAAGRETLYHYQWVADIADGRGGWRTTRTDPNGRTLIDDRDPFGRPVRHVDLGGRQFDYRYDHAGQLAVQSGSSGQDIRYQYYGNGNLKSIDDHAVGSHTLYEYDAEGNKTFEGYTTLDSAGQRLFHQYSEIEYDELNRPVRIHDPRFDIRYQYDPVGNRRRVHSYYHDGIDGTRSHQDYWYRYDALNRFVISKGSLQEGAVETGRYGVAVLYNGAGERVAARYGRDQHQEHYRYDANGHLTDTDIDGVLRSRRHNDLLGRALNYTEYAANGVVSSEAESDYDADHLLTQQTVDGKSTWFERLADGTLSRTYRIDGDTTIDTWYGYEWWDSAKPSTLTSQPYNNKAPGWKAGVSHYRYNQNGHMLEARDEAGQRHFRYTSNAQGLVLQRDEISENRLNLRHDYYYLDGQRIGDVGNDGDPRIDYAQALAQDRTQSRKQRSRQWRPINSADFDQNYEPVGPHYPARAPDSITVQSGDTLQTLARRLWGDRSLWYLLADANNLSGSETLVAGQRLNVPNRIGNLHNTSETFRVYQPGEAIGDTDPMLPDAPPPPRVEGGSSGGCGVMGKALIIIVAVVATVFTAGAAAVAMGAVASGMGVMAAGAAALTGGLSAGIGLSAGLIAAAAIGGAAGSLAGQGVAMASGQQKRFNWGQVGVSALSAGAGSAITGGPFGQMVGAAAGEWAAIAASAMAGSALTQSASSVLGIGHFNWTAVAAAGAGAMLGHSVGKGLHAAGLRQPLLSGTLKSMASGGAQSLVHGVRPNWGRIAAESFGNNVGHQVVGSAVERDREQQQQRQPQAIRREVAGQNDAVGYRDDGGLQARAETAWRQQERRRQTAIAEVQSLERGADVSLNGEAMLDEIVVTASRLPPGDEPGAMQRARDAYSEALKDALIGTGQILSDQMYFMASRASGGLIDDRGAAARNVELVRGTMDAIAGIPRQFAFGMYYLAHPDELNAEQIGRAMGGAAAGYAGGRVAAGLRGKGGVGYAGGGEGGPSATIFNICAAQAS